jgi:hypothetical protein
MTKDVDDKPARGKQPSEEPGIRSTSQTRVRIRLDDDTDEVGYAKPPKSHQFRPGRSGNPNGRPKGRKNESTMLDELLFKKIKVRENGRERWITVFEGMLRRFAEDSLKGNTKAAAFLFGRYSAAASTDPQQQELGDDDRAVINAFAQGLSLNSEGDGQ